VWSGAEGGGGGGGLHARCCPLRCVAVACGTGAAPRSSHFRHPPPATRHPRAESYKAYLKQLRETLAARLVDRVYNPDGTLNKFWAMFAKRKFLNKEFP
jgi:hypothetical protein